MKKIYLALLLLYPSTGATLAPDDFWEAEVVQHGECSDRESGDHGYCFVMRGDGLYLIFFDEKGARFIRRIRDDQTGYDTLWHRDGTAPPPGISL